MHGRDLNLNEDFMEDVPVLGKATTTSARQAATGVTFLARFAARKVETDGTPPAAIPGIVVTATELSGEPGTYRVVADQIELQSALSSYRRREVWLILKDAGNMDCVWIQYHVTDNRQAA